MATEGDPPGSIGLQLQIDGILEVAVFELQAGRHIGDRFAGASEQLNGNTRCVAEQIYAAAVLGASGAVDGHGPRSFNGVCAGLGLIADGGGQAEGEAGKAVGCLEEVGCFAVAGQFEVAHFLGGGNAVEIDGRDMEAHIFEKGE